MAFRFLSRTFGCLSVLPPLRPSITPSVRQLPFRALEADLVSHGALTTHPALASMQLRFSRRNTMNGATRLLQKRRSGFLARKRSKTGQNILKRRLKKGRKTLAW
ncbi:hypothetical protein CDD81_7959 [Ophiocordyceps australis]|uniref:Ribosomal protein L34 n=1 Tax=Ophiocordyceps australis TaxID=1399860 RepID=A0A2C5XX20_9HYPO|nr:hypothetical protein CDD81_7959 [Ophiocordyceps australis]